MTFLLGQIESRCQNTHACYVFRTCLDHISLTCLEMLSLFKGSKVSQDARCGGRGSMIQEGKFNSADSVGYAGARVLVTSVLLLCHDNGCMAVSRSGAGTDWILGVQSIV